MPLPAPPGPGNGEIPLCAVSVEPCPDPFVFAPGPSPEVLLPGPLPLLMLSPPPVPPSPGCAPPEGDIASDSAAPAFGEPTFGPGRADSTIPLASAGEGGTTDSDIVSPGPRLPCALELEPLDTEGAGCTTEILRDNPSAWRFIKDPLNSAGGGTTPELPKLLPCPFANEALLS